MPVPSHPPAQLEGNVEPGLYQNLVERSTAILANSLHFESLSVYDFSGSTLSPLTIAQKVWSGKATYQVWMATKMVLDAAQEESWTVTRETLVSLVVEHLVADLASQVYDRIQGPHLVFVDPRQHHDVASLVSCAHTMHASLLRRGIHKRDIVVSIPATDAGLAATQILQKENFLVNLYLVSSLLHAAACVEAKATMISIAVGPLLETYERKRKTDFPDLRDHPGIEAIQSTLAYFKLNGVKTKVIGTTFRDVAEIGLLSECDAVCVSAKQADTLRWSKVSIALLEDVDLPANLRARQAKYPTDLLTRSAGRSLTALFSPEARNLTTNFLREALDNMQQAMDRIDNVVAQEVDRQWAIASLSLAELVGLSSARRDKEELRATHEGSDDETTRETDDRPLLRRERSSTPGPMDEVF